MTAYADISALNWSSLNLLDPDRGGSPRLYRWRQTNPRPDTDALLLGRALGTAILELRDEPGLFDQRYFVPEIVRCEAKTKDGKGPQCKNNAVPGDTCCSIHGGSPETDGREVLTPHMAKVVQFAVENLEQNTHAMELLDGTEREKVIRWTVDGVDAKARVDAIKPTALEELKSTGGPLEKFGDQAARLGYHGQNAWYRDGAARAGVLNHGAGSYFIVVQTVEPYDNAVFTVPDNILGAGRELYQKLLDRWRSCRKLDRWPGRYPKPTELEFPRWGLPIDEDWS